jgi:hypothetical protein
VNDKVGKDGKGLLAVKRTTTEKAEKDTAKKAHLRLLSCYHLLSE